jgi:hypothetical protein
MCKRGNAFSLPVLIARSSLIALIFNAHSGYQWSVIRNQATDDKNRMAKDQLVQKSSRWSFRLLAIDF